STAGSRLFHDHVDLGVCSGSPHGLPQHGDVCKAPFLGAGHGPRLVDRFCQRHSRRRQLVHFVDVGTQSSLATFTPNSSDGPNLVAKRVHHPVKQFGASDRSSLASFHREGNYPLVIEAPDNPFPLGGKQYKILGHGLASTWPSRSLSSKPVRRYTV